MESDFSQAFAFELALGWLTPQEVRAHYKVSDEEWESLQASDGFRKSLESYLAYVQKEGIGFKRMAQVAANHVMAVVHRLAHDPSAPPSVQLAAAQTIVKWAGLDISEEAAKGPVVQMFFGSAPPVIDATPDTFAKKPLQIPEGVRIEI